MSKLNGAVTSLHLFKRCCDVIIKHCSLVKNVVACNNLKTWSFCEEHTTLQHLQSVKENQV